ncbi:FGGY-family carbohydrate kinase [Spirulina sp. CS-785/01]|uniref:FGGY-family carbohydrate kinase n=1 Tax=Spirulina sp. CS-785/01 TaxID=3021716 RepID=UPI00232A7E6A|nr:FGGY-family carbohydrate kinase [Spirulina sp. CS-785/01]MDB9315144.1 FGGY-family carbohydrate kinase [Spirulina sp. CS-785/01]
MLTLGIDFGTSGARAVAITATGEVVAEARSGYTVAQAQVWQEALEHLLEQLSGEVRSQVQRIAINGTSSTVLLCDHAGTPIADPLLYNDKRGQTTLKQIKTLAPPNHVVHSATSSLAKLLWWTTQPEFKQAVYFLHQADWLGFLLHGQLGISDYHNALKLGYDVDHLTYPDWLESLPQRSLLPQVRPPGSPVSNIQPDLAQRWQFPPHCLIYTGTTDSIAAFLASGATQPGEAVTSLGSTLVLKLLSRTKVEDSQAGVYSHRLGNLWLTGGASNTGGAVLQHFFNDSQLQSLSAKIDPTQRSPLEYYPLLETGDRFPINDPNLSPQLDPQPDNPVEFLHGLLESIARIETQGYEKLQTLGADALQRVYTAGGGAKNPQWTKIRQRRLQVPVVPSAHTEAAYGTARLAQGMIR